MKVHTIHNYLLNPEHPVTINVIGCGGNGSQVLTQLARINEALKKLGHPGLYVTCFDNDRITDSNIGRQLFSPAELGMNKAVALTTRLNRFFATNWKAVPIHYNQHVEENDRIANITITCVDSVKARKEIYKVMKSDAKKKNGDPLRKIFYWMDIGNSQNSGQFVLGTFDKKGLPHVFDKFPSFLKQKDKDTGPSCSLAEALTKQDLFINSTLTQLAMSLLWKCFREGRIQYHGAFINLETFKIAPIHIYA